MLTRMSVCVSVLSFPIYIAVYFIHPNKNNFSLFIRYTFAHIRTFFLLLCCLCHCPEIKGTRGEMTEKEKRKNKSKAQHKVPHNGDAIWCGHSSCNTIEYERHFIAVEILFIFEFVYLFSITFPIWQNDAIVEFTLPPLPLRLSLSQCICMHKYHSIGPFMCGEINEMTRTRENNIHIL